MEKDQGHYVEERPGEKVVVHFNIIEIGVNGESADSHVFQSLVNKCIPIKDTC